MLTCSCEGFGDHDGERGFWVQLVESILDGDWIHVGQEAEVKLIHILRRRGKPESLADELRSEVTST